MKITILQHDLLPLQCSNPGCSCDYDEAAFGELINQRGLVFADCGDVIFQGFSCNHCNHTTLIRTKRDAPIVDVSNFLLQPTLSRQQNIDEQIKVNQNAAKSCKHLHFKILPAWDEEKFSFLPTIFPKVLDLYPSLYHDEENVKELANSENRDGFIRLRRLYPATTYFHNLFTLVSPSKEISIIENFIDYANTRLNYNDTARSKAIEYFAEQVEGTNVNELVTKHMMDLGNGNFSEKDFLEIYKEETELPLHQQASLHQLNEMMRTVGWEDHVPNWTGWRRPYYKLIDNILKKLPLNKKRKTLGTWFEHFKKEKSLSVDTQIGLIVDAPMGLGKSYSIVKTLSENLELSAVIFMPTKALCSDISIRLKRDIAIKQRRNDYYIKELGAIAVNYATPDYLESEVYLVEGINDEECLCFDDITKAYKKLWYRKSDFCRDCVKKETCRFKNWPTEAPKSRIIVATHNQYNVFNKNEALHNWVISEDGKETEDPKRDMFIVDEDLVFTQCYAPIIQTPNELRRFCGSFPKFISEHFSEHEDAKVIVERVDTMFGLINKPDTTAIIPPLDPNFKIPNEIKDKWEKSYRNLHAYIPGYLERNKSIANLLDVFEHGIKYGVVVQRYLKVNKIFFPNPTTYDLSTSPPHVFFDGTKLDNKILENKLKGVEFKHFKVEPGVRWPHSVYQNINTDLSTSKIDKEQERVKLCLDFIFHKEGVDKKYFIHTTKVIRDSYLNAFLKKFEDRSIIVSHYGNIRGSNDAQDCNVHIMLGSYNPSDAQEVAMSLEFLQDILKDKEPMATYPYLWRWKGNIPQRTYESDYKAIGEISKAYRHAEQRQALARTRSIFHSVNFYIISKEPIDNYEHSLPEPETTQFLNHYFPPRKRRPDNQYDVVTKAITEVLGKREKACDMDIQRHTDIPGQPLIHRNTIRIHRNALLKERFIKMVSKRYYTLVPQKED